MDKYTDYYRKQFYQEARDIIEKLGDDILRAEADPEDRDILNAVFRGIHTIKGSAGSFDLEDIAAFAHHVEGLLSALRDGKIDLTPDLADLILAGADHISGMIEDSAAGRAPRTDADLTERFRSFMIREAEKSSPGKSDRTTSASGIAFPEELLSPEARNAFQEAVSLGLYAFRVRPRYSSDLLANGYDPMIFMQNLRHSCTFYHAITEPAVPCAETFDPMTLYLRPVIYTATALSAEDIRELTFDPDLVSIEEVHVPIDRAHSEPLHEFVDSAADMLESVEKAVIEYETSGSRESLNEIFRVVHNFKGDADLVGLEDITVFAQTLESLLERLRSGDIHRTFALIDVILQSVDFLRQCVNRLGKGEEVPEFPPLFETLKYYAAMKAEIDRKQHLLKNVSTELRDVFVEQAAQYREILLRNIRPLPPSPEKRKVIERTLRGLAKASAFVGLGPLRLRAEKAVECSEQEDDRALLEIVEKISGFISGLEGEPEEGTVPAPISPSPPDADRGQVGTEIRTMRINEQKIDHFTNMVGELLIARNTYDHLVRQLELAERQRHSDTSEGDLTRDEESGEGKVSLRKLNRAFKDNLRLFSRLTGDIHHGIMSLRMIPVGRIFQKFNRAVRDISRKQKKAIHLLTGGEKIEIDKKVADMLSEPLVHLVRNACDHGVEFPEERRLAGKSERGTVIIRASQEGGNLCISVIDDGRGIDRERLYESALAAGMDISSPEDPGLTDLVFMPGLSTRAEVSSLSGRGVGLDVVKSTVRDLGGNVSLVSNKGKGTEIRLSIPTTLGIDAVLFVEADGIPYAIPLDQIVETLRLPSGKLKRAGRRQIFHHRGEVLPAERLGTVLGTFGLSESRHSPKVSSELPVVIVKTAVGKYGLIVDRLDRNTEVAIKPLPGLLASIDLISGVSIMGDGKVFLILNPERLL